MSKNTEAIIARSTRLVMLAIIRTDGQTDRARSTRLVIYGVGNASFCLTFRLILYTLLHYE